MLAVSPDGRWLASSNDPSGPEDFSLRLWDLATGREIKRIQPREYTAFLTISNDGGLLAWVSFGSDYSEIRVLNLATDQEQRLAMAKGTWSLAFSPDGRTLASGTQEGALSLWELASGKERHLFVGHEGQVMSVAFSPDGRRLAAASPEAPVYIWDVCGVLLPSPRIPRDQWEGLWTDLAGADAAVGWQAIRKLASVPDQTVPSLRHRLKPMAEPDPERLQALLAQLDSDRFEERQQARKKLEAMEELTAATLRKAVATQESAEVRKQVEELLRKLEGPISSGAVLRGLRGVEILERIGTLEAKKLFETPARGAPEARLTRESKAAAARIELGPR